MAGRCMDHKGLCVEIANVKKDVEEIRQMTNLEKLWEELRKKPSTATILIGMAIVASIVMSIVTLTYQAHQRGTEKIDAQIKATNDRIDEQFSGIIKGLAVINDRIPEKKSGAEKPKK